MPESFPTPVAGNRITASLMRSMLPVIGRKTSDTSRSAVTTAAADPHLTFDVVADAVYVWDGWIKYDGPIAADIIVDFTAPTGALGEWVGWGAGITNVVTANGTPTLLNDTVSTRGYMTRMEANDVAQSRTFGCLGVGEEMTVLMYGTLRVGSTAGTFSLDWAQSTSDATAVTFYTDSWMKMTRIA